ncbi:MAG: hypothetical protein HYY18_08515 [Planctomycetes bacterium]|nr:hypothetical protein [Planctomycetota bacterium]
MRTVTFANTELADHLNANFVLVWFNHAPQFLEGQAPEGQSQPAYTPEEIAAYPEGGGGGNIRAFYCRPDGVIAHATQGWWGPATLRAEADRALGFLRATDPDDARTEARARLLADADRLETADPAERERPLRDAPNRRRAAALRLLAQSYTEGKALLGQPVAPVLDRIVEENADNGEIS